MLGSGLLPDWIYVAPDARTLGFTLARVARDRPLLRRGAGAVGRRIPSATRAARSRPPRRRRTQRAPHAQRARRRAARARSRAARLVGLAGAQLRQADPGKSRLSLERRAHRRDLAAEPRNIPTAPRGRAPSASIVDDVRKLPGVEAAGVVDGLPFAGYSGASFRIAGRPTEGQVPHGHVLSVGEDYFKAMGIPLLRGRDVLARRLGHRREGRRHRRDVRAQAFPERRRARKPARHGQPEQAGSLHDHRRRRHDQGHRPRQRAARGNLLFRLRRLADTDRAARGAHVGAAVDAGRAAARGDPRVRSEPAALRRAHDGAAHRRLADLAPRAAAADRPLFRRSRCCSRRSASTAYSRSRSRSAPASSACAWRSARTRPRSSARCSATARGSSSRGSRSALPARSRSASCCAAACSASAASICRPRDRRVRARGDRVGRVLAARATRGAHGAGRSAALRIDGGDRRMLADFWNDVRYAARRIAARPGFTIAVVADARRRHRRERARLEPDRRRLFPRPALSRRRLARLHRGQQRQAGPERRRRHGVDSGLPRPPRRRQRAFGQRIVPHDRSQPARRRRAGALACAESRRRRCSRRSASAPRSAAPSATTKEPSATTVSSCSATRSGATASTPIRTSSAATFA